MAFNQRCWERLQPKYDGPLRSSVACRAINLFDIAMGALLKMKGAAIRVLGHPVVMTRQERNPFFRQEVGVGRRDPVLL